MDEKIRKLIGFITDENPDILVSPCEFLNDIEEIKKYGNVKCTHENCENYSNCIKLNVKAPFLPPNSFNAWVVDAGRLKMGMGYIFYLASLCLKGFGVMAIKGMGDKHIALSYGFQPLYHGEWNYYLKSTSSEKLTDLTE